MAKRFVDTQLERAREADERANQFEAQLGIQSALLKDAMDFIRVMASEHVGESPLPDYVVRAQEFIIQHKDL